MEQVSVLIQEDLTSGMAVGLHVLKLSFSGSPSDLRDRYNGRRAQRPAGAQVAEHGSKAIMKSFPNSN